MRWKASAGIEPAADFLDATVFIQDEVSIKICTLPHVVVPGRILLILSEDNSFLAFHVRLSPGEFNFEVQHMEIPKESAPLLLVRT